MSGLPKKKRDRANRKAAKVALKRMHNAKVVEVERSKAEMHKILLKLKRNKRLGADKGVAPTVTLPSSGEKIKDVGTDQKV